MSHTFTAFMGNEQEGDALTDFTHFVFNSDLSGDVTISRQGDESRELKVPGKHLLQFVANYVRWQKIAVIEQAEDDEILGLPSSCSTDQSNK